MKKHYTELIPYEIAEHFKEAGYREPALFRWRVRSEGDIICTNITPATDWNGDLNPSYTSAPTYAEAIDWLMDKGYAIESGNVGTRWDCDLFPIGCKDPFGSIDSHIGGKSWEESVNHCLLSACSTIIENSNERETQEN